MFHILNKNSEQDYLCGGPWTGTNGSSSNVFPSSLECGLKGGQVREAISNKDFTTLKGSGKLNKDRVCINCFKSLEGYRPREKKEFVNS